MKNPTRFLLAILFILITKYSFSQYVSGGVNIADIPFQIYGGHVRLEPTDNFYVEAFGSYRPLAERQDVLFGSYERKGTVLDLSAGIQHAWWSKGRRNTVGFGPYVQRKRFSVQEQCGGIALLGCGQLLPERIHAANIGLRVGLALAFRNGLYFQSYAGLGGATKQSENKLIHAREARGVSIEHDTIFGHARLILGWQFDLHRSK